MTTRQILDPEFRDVVLSNIFFSRDIDNALIYKKKSGNAKSHFLALRHGHGVALSQKLSGYVTLISWLIKKPLFCVNILSVLMYPDPDSQKQHIFSN